MNNKYKIAVIILGVALTLGSIILLIRPRKPLRLMVTPRGRIAIVLDDWGYNLNNLSLAGELKFPLTMSVLPNLNYSRSAAERLHQQGFEVILHLPLEPREQYRMEKNTILTGYSEEQIRNIVALDLKSIAYARGVSNHMGSRATADPRVMGVILRELKKRQLYFLDSFVSGKSVCSGLAGKIGLGFARRDVFIDNKLDKECIRGQIYRLKNKGRAKGYAIGIGHDRKATLEVLKEMVPRLEREGYKFVFVSELVK